MAITSIWSVKGQLGKVLDYAENSQKTERTAISEPERQCLSDVIAYAIDDEKTRDMKGEMLHDESLTVMQRFVSGINCTPMTARLEMMAVKEKYGKVGGIIAFHGYQSFAPGECTPELAHELGIKLARELWEERFQVLVTTHLDKEHHLHNHFVVNSVSFSDGLRYHRTKKDYCQMRQISDKLCRAYGLSVVKEAEGKKAKQYGEWRREQAGLPTYHSLVKEDVDTAIEKSLTEKQFYYQLRQMGYHLKFGKDITARPPGRERGLKLARNFGESYTREAICQRILSRTAKRITSVIPEQIDSKQKPILFLKMQEKPRRRIGGIKGLYIHYCYQLGIFPRNRSQRYRKSMHFLLKEDLQKLDIISKEVRLLCRNHIETTEQLFHFKEQKQKQQEQLMDIRKRLRYKLRGKKNEAEKAALKQRISDITGLIAEVRNEIKLCDGISRRSVTIKDKLHVIKQDTRTDRPRKRKGELSDEHIRRSR